MRFLDWLLDEKLTCPLCGARFWRRDAGKAHVHEDRATALPCCNKHAESESVLKPKRQGIWVDVRTNQ